MAQPVVMGDMLTCSFGMAPGSITVLPANKVTAVSKPMANIMDNKPFVNIPMFGNCMSLANPATASLTAAALGVLTPGPCTPATAAPWAPGSATVLVANFPALNSTSKCMCSYGGVIGVTVPSAMTVDVP
jgi:hypothetical protein